MNEIDLIIDLHKDSQRQGPGSEEETLKALDFMNLPNDRSLNIADIGCGSGGQTISIANKVNGCIVAVDLFSPFLETLQEKSKNAGLSKKIKTLQASMDKLPFDNNEFDVIWSEGAIYNIGFEEGIKNWKTFLKDGGYLAISEITWITHSRPKEIENFWLKEYPEIDTASNKIKCLEENGFTLTGYFYLKQDSWIKNYYNPMRLRFEQFLNRHNSSELAYQIVEENKAEIDLYLQYKDYYSYGFYIAKKI